MPKIEDEAALLSVLVQTLYQCEEYSAEQSDDRRCALEYYEGFMNDMETEEGRSSMVSKDLRANVRKLMPSVMRTLFGSDKLVEYEEAGPGQQEQAQQATDYVNKVIIPKCGAEDALFDAVFDAMLLRTGILKWYAVEDPQSMVYEYTGHMPLKKVTELLISPMLNLWK